MRGVRQEHRCERIRPRGPHLRSRPCHDSAITTAAPRATAPGRTIGTRRATTIVRTAESVTSRRKRARTSRRSANRTRARSSTTDVQPIASHHDAGGETLEHRKRHPWATSGDMPRECCCMGSRAPTSAIVPTSSLATSGALSFSVTARWRVRSAARVAIGLPWCETAQRQTLSAPQSKREPKFPTPERPTLHSSGCSPPVPPQAPRNAREVRPCGKIRAAPPSRPPAPASDAGPAERRVTCVIFHTTNVTES